MDYYNHLVFEFKSSKLGSQSAVLAGGRYDRLIEILGGASTPAIGWGAGVERLALLYPSSPSPFPDIGLVALGRKAEKELFHLAFRLREQGYRVFYRFAGNLSKQITRISKKSCSVALILGDKELYIFLYFEFDSQIN